MAVIGTTVTLPLLLTNIRNHNIQNISCSGSFLVISFSSSDFDGEC